MTMQEPEYQSRGGLEKEHTRIQTSFGVKIDLAHATLSALPKPEKPFRFLRVHKFRSGESRSEIAEYLTGDESKNRETIESIGFRRHLFIYLLIKVWGVYSWDLAKRGLALKDDRLMTSFSGTVSVAVNSGLLKKTPDGQYRCQDVAALARLWGVLRKNGLRAVGHSTFAAVRNQALAYTKR